VTEGSIGGGEEDSGGQESVGQVKEGEGKNKARIRKAVGNRDDGRFRVREPQGEEK